MLSNVANPTLAGMASPGNRCERMVSNQSVMRILLPFLAVARIAAGCTCSPAACAPLCQRIDAVKVLFVGTAAETNDNHDGFIKGGLWYRFSVEEPFKGIDSGVNEVI